jgi:hypothetical protein
MESCVKELQYLYDKDRALFEAPPWQRPDQAQ